MTDEELEKAAWKIYRDALEMVEFPDYVFVHKKEDGSLSFTLILQCEANGTGIISYKPSINIIKNRLAADNSDLDMSKSLSSELENSWCYCFAYENLKTFHVELAETFTRLHQIPATIPAMAMVQTLEELEGRDSSKSKSLLEKLLDERKESTRKRIETELELARKPSKPAKHLIAYFHNRLEPKWVEAKRCYKQFKSYKNPLERVAEDFDTLPVDLIKKLEKKENPGIADDSAVESQPSNIALRHAARLCGVKEDSLNIRTLRIYLKESREWCETAGEEKIGNEITERVRRDTEIVIEAYRIAKRAGRAVPIEALTFSQKIIARICESNLRKLVEEDEDNFSESVDDSKIH